MMEQIGVMSRDAAVPESSETLQRKIYRSESMIYLSNEKEVCYFNSCWLFAWTDLGPEDGVNLILRNVGE
jgi:hypothetical protein